MLTEFRHCKNYPRPSATCDACSRSL